MGKYKTQEEMPRNDGVINLVLYLVKLYSTEMPNSFSTPPTHLQFFPVKHICKVDLSESGGGWTGNSLEANQNNSIRQKPLRPIFKSIICPLGMRSSQDKVFVNILLEIYIGEREREKSRTSGKGADREKKNPK